MAGWISELAGCRSTLSMSKIKVRISRNPYFYFQHGESTSKASQLTSPASQKSNDPNKGSLLLQDLGLIIKTRLKVQFDPIDKIVSYKATKINGYLPIYSLNLNLETLSNLKTSITLL